MPAFSILNQGGASSNSFKISGLQSNGVDASKYNNSRYGEVEFNGKNTPENRSTKFRMKVGTQVVDLKLKGNSTSADVARAAELALKNRFSDRFDVSRNGKTVRVAPKR